MAKAKKRPKLPFVVAPRLQPIQELVGTEETGQIEITRQGYLSVGEKAFMSSAEANDDSTSYTVTLCKRVAHDLEIDLNEAYTAVVAAATGQGEDKHKLSQKYPEELRELLTLFISAESRRSYLKALCILLYRVNPEINIDDIGDLHPELIQAIVDLYDDEEKQSVSRLEEAARSEQDADVVEALSTK